MKIFMMEGLMFGNIGAVITLSNDFRLFAREFIKVELSCKA